MDIISISDNTSPNSTRGTATGFNVKLPRRNSVTSLPISIASGSTQKCPVTWNSEPKHRISISTQLVNNVTPMVNNRVKMWLASTMQLQQSAMMPSPQHNTSFEHSDSGSNSSIMDEYIMQRSHREELPKRNILIRHDFDRDDEIISNVCSYKTSWKYNSDMTLNGHCNGKLEV
ncbi:hypothetical protein QE152_g7477 [Popillia japonica]|uniref:Uncharacterized protein n=1 Tax=Popillia japonica TaxID=7064 RepID=A0AAW1MB81_POPJA